MHHFTYHTSINIVHIPSFHLYLDRFIKNNNKYKKNMILIEKLIYAYIIAYYNILAEYILIITHYGISFSITIYK